MIQGSGTSSRTAPLDDHASGADQLAAGRRDDIVSTGSTSQSDDATRFGASRDEDNGSDDTGFENVGQKYIGDSGDGDASKGVHL